MIAMDNNAIGDLYQKRKFYRQMEVDPSDIELQYILRYIPEDHSAPILDAGCGNGKYALALLQRGYSQIVAVDLFESIPVQEIRYFRSGIENLPFKKDFFEFVYSNSVIYHVQDPGRAVEEFSRILKPGGILLFTAHTKYSLFTLKRVFMRMVHSKSVNHLKDVKFKSAREYIDLLHRQGFEILRVDGFGMSFILVPLYKRCRNILLKYIRLKLPAVPVTITKSGFLAKLKSWAGYHMIIVARNGR
jgi:SAM-dependent methyltransferase